jgi:hypothetical protein
MHPYFRHHALRILLAAAVMGRCWPGGGVSSTETTR